MKPDRESASTPVRLVLLIRSLGRGGAERQLLSLAAGLAERHEVTIVTFYAVDNALAAERHPAVGWQVIGKRSRWDVLGFAFNAIRAFRSLKPDLVYAFLSTASLVSLLARVARPQVKLVWGLRTSYMDFSRFDRLSRWARMLECRLCRTADLLIANAEAGRVQALREGFRPRRLEVVPNGIDTQQFRPDDAARARVRGEFGLADTTPTIGIVARFDPMKGLDTFIDAVALCIDAGQPWYFVIVGTGDDYYRARLVEVARERALGERLLWYDGSAGAAHMYPAFDVMTSASRGEGFSNVIAEAMACAVPCVVTDVGVSAELVGETGRAVPPDDAAAMARAWADLLEMPVAERVALGARARERVVQNYSVPHMVAATESLLLNVLDS